MPLAWLSPGVDFASQVIISYNIWRPFWLAQLRGGVLLIPSVLEAGVAAKHPETPRTTPLPPPTKIHVAPVAVMLKLRNPAF